MQIFSNLQDLALFFDRFGLIVFLFILFDAVYDIMRSRRSWRVWLRLVIGIAGLVVDGTLVAIDILK